jgi:hypothetical protein
MNRTQQIIANLRSQIRQLKGELETWFDPEYIDERISKWEPFDAALYEYFDTKYEKVTGGCKSTTFCDEPKIKEILDQIEECHHTINELGKLMNDSRDLQNLKDTLKFFKVFLSN